MSTRIEQSQPIRTPATPPPAPIATTTPPGIAAQGTTLSPVQESSPPSLYDHLSNAGKFLHAILVSILEALTGLLSTLTSFVRGDPAPESSPNDWMLPNDVQTLPDPPPPQPPNTITPVVHVDPPPPIVNPFSTLPIIPNEKQKIFQIIHTLGTTTPILLWPQQGTLERLGQEIDHVHPLKFLEYILQHPTLRGDLDTVRRSSILWPQFLSGLAGKMQREREGLPTYFPGFAEAMDVDQARLEPFIAARNWEEMVFFLIDVKLRRILLPSRQIAPVPPTIVNTEPPPSETLAPPTPPTDETAQVINTPPTLPQIALSDAEKNILGDLVRSYRSMSYLRAVVYSDQRVNALWYRLDQAHPLALLEYLFTNPELTAEINTLKSYRLHWRTFMTELRTLLNRRPLPEVLPHIADFARAVGREEGPVSAHIHLQMWDDLVELLRIAPP